MKAIFSQRIDYTVYKELLRNIKSGEWKSGEKLPSEGELSRILRVGRVSVRSALQRLQALGYIETVRAKGSFVCGVEDAWLTDEYDPQARLTREEFRETTEWRDMLESAAIENLLAKTGPVDFSKFTEAFRGMCRAAEAFDVDAYTKFDHRFHLNLILATGNDKFIRNAQIFREDFYLLLKMRNQRLRPDGPHPDRVRFYFDESIQYHANLHDALTERDARALDIRKKKATSVSARLFIEE